MKTKLTIILLFIAITGLKAQKNEYFFNNFTAGSSLTYIWDSEIYGNTYTGAPGEYKWFEYTWNINFAASLSEKMQIGVQVLNIFTSGTRIENSYNTIYGVFAQYDFFSKIPHRRKLFIDMSFNRGNYFTGDILDPYTREGLWYHGMGGGVELPLSKRNKRIYIDLSFYNYWILNKIEKKYNYTQYVIGLNYHIGKPLKS